MVFTSLLVWKKGAWLATKAKSWHLRGSLWRWTSDGDSKCYSSGGLLGLWCTRITWGLVRMQTESGGLGRAWDSAFLTSLQCYWSADHTLSSKALRSTKIFPCGSSTGQGGWELRSKTITCREHWEKNWFWRSNFLKVSKTYQESSYIITWT